MTEYYFACLLMGLPVASLLVGCLKIRHIPERKMIPDGLSFWIGLTAGTALGVLGFAFFLFLVYMGGRS